MVASVEGLKDLFTYKLNGLRSGKDLGDATDRKELESVAER